MPPGRLPHRTGAPALDGEAGRAGLLFCGIASEDRRRGEALDGAAEAVAGLWAVAAAVLLALPLVKLLLAGSQDPVRAADVRALAACSGLALLALGAAALAVPVTRSLSARSDAALSSVASTARRDLEIEIDRLRRQAAELDRRRARPARGRSCANVLALFGSPAVGCPALPVAALDYPYFASMSWAAENGDQVARWRTTLPGPGHVPRPTASSRSRPATTSARCATTACGRSGATGGRRAGSVLHPVDPLALDRPHRRRAVDPLRRPGAAADGGRHHAPALRVGSVLPPDVGLAVVDRDGEVLFHSNPAQSLTHNLLAETADDGRLRAAVSGSADVVASGRYWGRRHLFATAPLHEVPWSIVAFRDEAPAREAAAEVARGGLALALAYAAAVGGLSWLALARGDRRGVRGPWPRPDRRCAYVEAIATLAVVAAAWLLVLRTAPPERAVWLAFAAPPPRWPCWRSCSAPRRWRAPRRCCRPPGAAARTRRPRASRAPLHATALALGGVCVAVLPGVSLAQAAAGRVLQDFAARERRALQARTAARSESAAVFHGHLLRRDRGTTQEGAATPDGRSCARAWPRRSTSIRRACSRRRRRPGTASVRSGSVPPVVRPPPVPRRARPSAVSCCSASCAALLVRWTTRRVLPDAVRPEPRSYDDLRQGRVASAVCLLPSGSDVDRALQGGWCRRIDVREGVAGASADPSRPAAIDLRGFAEAREDARASTRAFAEALCDDRRRPRVPRRFPSRGRPAAPGRTEERRTCRRRGGRLAAAVRAAGDGGRARRGRGLRLARRAVGASPARASPPAARACGSWRRSWGRRRACAGSPTASWRPAAFAAHDREAMVARLAEIAEDYYADLWGACAADERRVLADVCAGAFVAWAQRDAAGRASTAASRSAIRWCGP